MTASHKLRIAATFVILIGSADPASASAQSSANVAGAWLARNFRPRAGVSFTVLLDLEQHGDSVVGRVHTESAKGEPSNQVPLFGRVRADSLFLATAAGTPYIAVKISESLLVGRMIGTQGRLNRGVLDLKALRAEGRPVRFERSAK